MPNLVSWFHACTAGAQIMLHQLASALAQQRPNAPLDVLPPSALFSVLISWACADICGRGRQRFLPGLHHQPAAHNTGSCPDLHQLRADRAAPESSGPAAKGGGARTRRSPLTSGNSQHWLSLFPNLAIFRILYFEVAAASRPGSHLQAFEQGP